MREMQKTEAWLEHVNIILKQDTLAESDVITWLGYCKIGVRPGILATHLT